MVFSSLVFLCIFLPVVFCLHCLVRRTAARNAVLVAASLLFYAFGEPVYVLLLVLSAFLNYLFALFAGGRRKKAVLAAAVITNIGLLGVFKYAAFAVGSLNAFLHLSIPVPQITLPVGISFFTFQALSYVIDVYRGGCAAQKNFFRVLLYISFFPQLIAGPIVKYKDIEAAISDRQVTVGGAAAGLRRFAFGLAKKVLIANAMAAAADAVFAQSTGNLNMASAWIGAAAYTLQIYFDFSGYSDMAIGMGRMFGFRFRENFRFPYTACSIREFWQRWHISLSSWFRDYVYIPLGGNRKGAARTGFNRILVFFLTGLWHGASWTFVVWGLFHGLFSLLEGLAKKPLRIPRALRHVYTMLVVTVGLVIFRSDTLAYAFRYIGKMFAGADFSAMRMTFALGRLTPYFLVMLAAAVFFAGPFRLIAEAVSRRSREAAAAGVPVSSGSTAAPASSGTGNAVLGFLLYAAAFVLLAWCIIRLSGGSYNPFIYFRF